jgi:hypothetical protein
MFGRSFGRTGAAWVLAASATLAWSACGGVGPVGKPSAAESNPPALAAMEHADPTLILDADNERPAPLSGDWRVATGERTCNLLLVIENNELDGQSTGCSDAAGPRPIAIGLVSGSSFLFQTGRGSEGWIWSGRYNSANNTLEGRREHVITGKLESFVARR